MVLELGQPLDFLRLMRPVNSVMVGFAVLVGVAVVSPLSLLSLRSLQGFLTGFFVSAYSMVVNDYFDVRVDRVNNPDRPIASGRVSLRASLIFAFLLVAIGVASSFIRLENFIVAIVFAGIGWAYSSWGKKRGLLGNMMVASSLAVPYIYGATVVAAWSDPLVWLLASTSFLAGTGREVVKTVPDVKGDELRSIRSIARSYGASAACKIGGGFYIAAIVSAALPILIGRVGLVYTVLVLIPDAIFIYASFKLFKDSSDGNALFIKKLSLLGMLTGLIAFIVGGSVKR
ncbi:MAG: geranylgeranylglycerol-phosphate geranylgeranyltransferase [Thaumarchaeota archaeon]|nr:geranylgeranylglycerol-phosphate geranylgeranyltransferase [Nitrososphaerota archaeon]